jgi:hypothetical protein
MRQWGKNTRFFQKKEYHHLPAPIVLCPFHGRSPFGLDNWGVAWYVPRCKTVRAYGR